MIHILTSIFLAIAEIIVSFFFVKLCIDPIYLDLGLPKDFITFFNAVCTIFLYYIIVKIVRLFFGNVINIQARDEVKIYEGELRGSISEREKEYSRLIGKIKKEYILKIIRNYLYRVGAILLPFASLLGSIFLVGKGILHPDYLLVGIFLLYFLLVFIVSGFHWVHNGGNLLSVIISAIRYPFIMFEMRGGYIGMSRRGLEIEKKRNLKDIFIYYEREDYIRKSEDFERYWTQKNLKQKYEDVQNGDLRLPKHIHTALLIVFFIGAMCLFLSMFIQFHSSIMIVLYIATIIPLLFIVGEQNFQKRKAEILKKGKNYAHQNYHNSKK